MSQGVVPGCAKWLTFKNANGQKKKRDLHGIEALTHAAESLDRFRLYKHQSIDPETTRGLRCFNYCQPLMCTEEPTVSELIYRPAQYAAASLYAELHSHYEIRHCVAGMQGVSCITAPSQKIALKQSWRPAWKPRPPSRSVPSPDSHCEMHTALIRAEEATCGLPKTPPLLSPPLAGGRPVRATGYLLQCISLARRQNIPPHRVVTKMGTCLQKPPHWHCGLVSPDQNKPLFDPQNLHCVFKKEQARQLNSKKTLFEAGRRETSWTPVPRHDEGGSVCVCDGADPG